MTDYSPTLPEGTDPETAEKTDAETTLSPKVLASGVTALVLAVALGAINAITPDLFDFLGPWGTVAYGGVISLGAFLAGRQVRDPLRG